MQRWLSQLQEGLNDLEAQGLSRTLDPVQHHNRLIERDGQSLLNLAGNDYLGLAGHPHICQAAIQAIQTHGYGSGASRLVSGHTPIHAEAEARFAAFKKAEAALIFPTGYMANLAVVTTLAAPGDLICIDKLNHASLLDAARASAATVRVYPHRNTAKLERLLTRHANTQPRTEKPPQRLIITDSVFSMDGDTADLTALCDIADRHDAILIVDEAHGTGVLGESGAGLCELQGVSDRVAVVISTASKALGGLGGIVTARHEIIHTLINRARPFIYTTAIPAAQAAAISAALDVIRDEPWRRHCVLDLAKALRTTLEELDLATTASPSTGHDTVTPIVPVIVGPPRDALALADHLQKHGIYAPAIRPPTVPPNTARVRLSLRADLEDADIETLLTALKSWAAHRDI